MASGEATDAFAAGYHLGSAHVQDNTVYVYGVDRWGGSEIQVFWSTDLKSWSSQTALSLPGWGIYYSWGNQQGVEHLAHAIYEGALSTFLQNFFLE